MKKEGKDTYSKSINKELLKILACTKCKSPLEIYKDGVRRKSCGKEFKFEDGILIME